MDVTARMEQSRHETLRWRNSVAERDRFPPIGGEMRPDNMARKYHHPFEPYEIQQQFMDAVYDCIENSKVGIFESPTGTGKSLSLICGSLTWLREHKRKTFDEAMAAIQLEDDEPVWMVEYAREARRKEARQIRTDLEARLEVVRKREKQVRERQADGEPAFKKRRQEAEVEAGADTDDSQFILDDYDSDTGDQASKTGASEFSSETTRLMEKLGMLQKQQIDQALDGDPDDIKVFFCSRTHSQLSQFIGELQRVKLPPGLPPDMEDSDTVEPLKHITLGSRKNLCINQKVSAIGSQTAINERCMELQQPNTPSDQKCPYLPNKEKEALVLDFRDHALAKIRDIEDLTSIGRHLQICPYYASRSAIGLAEMVTLPYPLLLQKSAREALGISLKRHIVIIDEAHNLINAVEGIYSAHISEKQLSRARECLMIYLQKFRNRLAGRNRVYVTQVIRVLDSLLRCTSKYKGAKDSGGTLQSSELLSGKGVDQINLAKLVRYISESKLARKVEGYVAHSAKSVQANGKIVSMANVPDTPTLTHVQNFLMTIMNPSKEGQCFWARENDTIILRYLLLDPSEHFREIVEDARAVILAGGTMSPMDEHSQQLFPWLQSINTLSCGHLIPPESLLVRTITHDSQGPLEFSFKKRGKPANAARIGNVLESLARDVKGGLVVFFPSYGYLEEVTDHWRKDSSIERLGKIKPFFHDSRGGHAEDTFKRYSETIRKENPGAILLSVIGGKLSEGINFSDDLGRCVVVVGLPFPNLETPEWKARLQYIDGKAVARGEPKGQAGREHAENVCMRSVNQAIGRVIRHKDDWASIVLMDSRYSQDRIRGKLPGWIKTSMPSVQSKADASVERVSRDVAEFFDRKRT